MTHEQQRDALAGPDERRQRGEQQTLGVGEDLERARHRAHLLVELREVPAAPQREVGGERDPTHDEPGGGDRGGPLTDGGVCDVEPREDREQRGEHAGVEDALGDDRAEDRAPLGGRARAEDRDPQQLAAARGQHVVAHVADEREPVGVGPPVGDLGQPHDAMPAPAAGRQGDRVDTQRAHEPQVAAEAVGELRRVLLGHPPGDRGQRDHRDDDGRAALELRARPVHQRWARRRPRRRRTGASCSFAWSGAASVTGRSGATAPGRR